MPESYSAGMYPKERSGKGLARLFMYGSIIKKKGIEWFRSSNHLVLAGPQANDVRFLLSQGVPAQNIFAVERDRDAAHAAQKLFPVVPIRLQTLKEFVHQETKKGRFRIDVAFLDFCSNISPAMAEDISRVSEQILLPGAFLAATFFVGREQGEVRDTIMKDLPQYANDEYGAHLARIKAFRFALQRYGSLPRLQTHRWFFYKSQGASVHGNQVTKSMGLFLGVRTTGESLLTTAEHQLIPVSEEHPKHLALELHYLGFRAPDIAPLLGFTRQQVAGWFAAFTKAQVLKDLPGSTSPRKKKKK